MSLPIPKRLGGGTIHRSQARSKDQEKGTAKRIGGRVVKQSGAGRFQKGDVRVMGVALVEAKTTQHASFRVTEALIDKIEGEATALQGEVPVIEVEILSGARRVYVVPTWALDHLIQRVQDLEAELQRGADEPD